MSGITIGLSKRSSGGGGPAVVAAPRNAVGVLNFLLLMPGLLTCLTARMLYPLLDDNAVLGVMIGLFLLPFLIQLVVIVRKQANARVLRIAFGCSACALLILGLLLFANGRTDRSPVAVTRAEVLRKTVFTGRYGVRQYHLIVSSWRSGRESEELDVTLRVFQRASVGSSVAIELHRGYLGLPWLGRISVE